MTGLNFTEPGGLAAAMKFIDLVQDFFGCPLKKIDPILLRYAIKNNYPEELRNCRDICDLPGYVESGTINPVFPFVDVKIEIVEQIAWVIEHKPVRWSCVCGQFGFADEHDAVEFKLTFSQ